MKLMVAKAKRIMPCWRRNRDVDQSPGPHDPDAAWSSCHQLVERPRHGVEIDCEPFARAIWLATGRRGHNLLASHEPWVFANSRLRGVRSIRLYLFWAAI